MLKTLTIKNVALIEYANIDFKSGLNVLSGETGSGKSVILESLNFVLGAKADKTLIKSGETECVVKAIFAIDNAQSVKKILNEFDIESEDDLIIVRKFTIDGKSNVKINGETVTISMLKQITSHLVDVHGQSEHFHLLKTSNQLKLIDKFGAEEILPKINIIKELYQKYNNVCSELDKLGGEESQRLIKIDILNYQIDEIEKLDLKEGEEEELLEIKSKLEYQDKISTALNCVKTTVLEEGGISDILGNALRALSTISNLSQDFSTLEERLSSAFSEIDDIAETAGNMIDDFDFSEYNVDSIENRLESIKSLKKKYGENFEQIQEFLSKANIERERLINFNELAENLLKEKNKLENALYVNYSELHCLRKNFSKIFSKNVLDELTGLGMPNASFEVIFQDFPSREECKFNSSNGIDVLEFNFSANLGEPLKPLSNVISGGEMSRFMLAVKTQTAKFNDIATFIFDEIDAGISGNVARVVAEKFAKISKTVQIIAISHLPQISSMADNNLLITKKESCEKTVTEVTTLNFNDKVKEITRLIGGDLNSISAKAHAEELISSADEFKSKL